MVESTIGEAAMAVGKKKRSKKKKKKGAGPIPLVPAPPEVSKLKAEDSKSPISMGTATMAGRNKGRRRMPGQTLPPATAAPSKGKVGGGGSPGGKGKKIEVVVGKVGVVGSGGKKLPPQGRKRGGQNLPPATAAPPLKGTVWSRWLRGKGKKVAAGIGKVAMAGFGGKKWWQGRNRGKARVSGRPNNKRSSGIKGLRGSWIWRWICGVKNLQIIKKGEGRVPGIVGYALVLQWPGGIEKSGKPLKMEFSSSNGPQRLYLHGLWPLQKGQDDTYESISKESNDYLRPEDLSSKVHKHLDVYFPSIMRGFSNIKFWGVEWLHHGKAAESKWKSLDPTNYKARYLMESVSIFRKYRQKIENALRGLQAKMNDPEAHDIVCEIHREIGHLVKIQAVKREGCRYLYQIHLFLDTNLLLQDYYAGSMTDKRLYVMCKARHQINIP